MDEPQKQYYLCLDESGNIHKNGKERYFVIGGMLIEDLMKVKGKFRRSMRDYAKKKALNPNDEIKASCIKNSDKKAILSSTFKGASYAIAMVLVDKQNCRVSFENTNLYYNYFVGVLVDHIMSHYAFDPCSKLNIRLDSRSIKLKDMKNLQDYLITKVCDEQGRDLEIDVKYLPSHHHMDIQIADFICNYFWRMCKHNTVPLNGYKNHLLTFFPRNSFGK